MLLFSVPADPALRGEAGSQRRRGQAHHQDPALPSHTHQPAVPGQRGPSGSRAGGRSLSVSRFSIQMASAARRRALWREGLMEEAAPSHCKYSTADAGCSRLWKRVRLGAQKAPACLALLHGSLPAFNF